MATPQSTPRTRSGRPTASQSTRLGETLRKAALDVFVERGFDGATMEAVAKAAGVTKRTLYGRYPDKRTLFVAVVSWAMSRREQHIPEVPVDDLEEGLLVIGRATLERALDPVTSTLSRIVMTDTSRFPEFADSARSLLWSPRMQALMDLLHHHNERGTIALDDVEMAAEQFLGLVQAIPERLAAFGITRPADEEDRRLHGAVRLFMFGAVPRTP